MLINMATPGHLLPRFLDNILVNLAPLGQSPLNLSSLTKYLLNLANMIYNIMILLSWIFRQLII